MTTSTRRCRLTFSVGASSLERLPVEDAVKRVTEEFKAIRLGSVA